MVHKDIITAELYNSEYSTPTLSWPRSAKRVTFPFLNSVWLKELLGASSADFHRKALTWTPRESVARSVKFRHDPDPTQSGIFNHQLHISRCIHVCGGIVCPLGRCKVLVIQVLSVCFQVITVCSTSTFSLSRCRA